MANKSLLVDLNVFIADNAVRRALATFRVNAQSADADVNTRDTNVLPDGGTFNYTSIPDNTMTIIKTTKPLTAEIDQGSTSFAVVINSILVLSDEIESIVFTNDGEDAAQLTIIQI